MTKGIIYYTNNSLEPKIDRAVQESLKATGLPIVSASLKPMVDFGKNIHVPEDTKYLGMFMRILAALENSDSDVVFFCEHDVLYPKEHFDFTPPSPDKFYYDLNWYKIGKGDLAVHWDAVQVSGLACYKDLARKYYASRVATFDPENFDRKFEPTVETEYETWRAPVPHIDIRHQTNTTYNKWHLHHFRDQSTAVNFQETTIANIPGWSKLQLESLIK